MTKSIDEIYPTNLDDCVLQLANDLYNIGYKCAYEVLRSKNITEIGGLSDPLKRKLIDMIGKYISQLSEDDYNNPYINNYIITIFSFGQCNLITKEEKVARAKLGINIGVALDRIEIKNYLKLRESQKGKFNNLSTFDKDHLIDISSFNKLEDALLLNDDVFPLDQYLPLNLKKLILDFKQKNKNLKVKMAISGDKIFKCKYSFQLTEEREYGPPFSEGELKAIIKNKKAFCRYKRKVPTNEVEKSIEESFKRPLLCFEVLRTEKDDCLSFMFEQLSPLPQEIMQKGFIITYLFHSEYDRKKKIFRHSDGSLLIYSSNSYNSRIKVTLEKKIKAETHLKLFRIDDGLTFSDWSLILRSIFHCDDIIQEFLNGK